MQLAGTSVFLRTQQNRTEQNRTFVLEYKGGFAQKLRHFFCKRWQDPPSIGWRRNRRYHWNEAARSAKTRPRSSWTSTPSAPLEVEQKKGQKNECRGKVVPPSEVARNSQSDSICWVKIFLCRVAIGIIFGRNTRIVDFFYNIRTQNRNYF